MGVRRKSAPKMAYSEVIFVSSSALGLNIRNQVRETHTSSIIQISFVFSATVFVREGWKRAIKLYL
jgi:hypothetical protein